MRILWYGVKSRLESLNPCFNGIYSMRPFENLTETERDKS